jgi:hypothetical protein
MKDEAAKSAEENSKQQNGSDETDTSDASTRLPCVRDLRSHFEVPATANKSSMLTRAERSSVSSNGSGGGRRSLTEDSSSDQESQGSSVRLAAPHADTGSVASTAEDVSDYVEPIFVQFSDVNEEEEIRKPRPTTRSWDPVSSFFERTKL